MAEYSQTTLSEALATAFEVLRRCEGAIALKVRTSPLASNVASSTSVLMTDDTAFHSAGLEVFAGSDYSNRIWLVSLDS